MIPSPVPIPVPLEPLHSMPTKAFQIRTMTLFLTYPKTTTPKEVALERIVEKWGEILQYAVVASELHADNTPHLHALVRLSRRISSTDAHFADFVSGSHGNYQSVKSIPQTYKYVTKGGNFVVHGDVPEGFEKPPKVTIDLVAQQMVNGATVFDVFRQHPGKFLLHRHRIESFREFLQTVKHQEKEPFPGFDYEALAAKDDSFLLSLVEWLDVNLTKPREFKQKQLYLSGPTSSGKTSMIIQLQKYFRVYFVPMDEEFYDEYDDGLYDLCVFEEFSSQKTITWLNSFLDGAPKTIRKKQRQYLKMKRIPCVILSNLDIDECYPNVREKHPALFDAFKERLTVLRVPTPVVDLDDSYIPGLISNHFPKKDKYFIELPIKQ